MSRSNPQGESRNPASRWFEWSGGQDGGFIRHYDKEAKQSVRHDLPFQFLVLDELATVKGWHDASDSGIYANEVRDTRNDALVVRSFKGGELAAGFYADIRDRIRAQGGHYAASVYIAYKGDDGKLAIGNLTLKGSAVNAWVDFKKANRKAVFEQAVVITSFRDDKKGGTKFRVPVFAVKEASPESQASATALDTELQAFLADYLRARRDEAAVPAPQPAPEMKQYPVQPEREPEPAQPEFLDDDIPF